MDLQTLLQGVAFIYALKCAVLVALSHWFHSYAMPMRGFYILVTSGVPCFIFAEFDQSLCCFAASGSQRPSYPSSKPRRDWDKIEAEVKKEVWLLSSIFPPQYSLWANEFNRICYILGERRKTRWRCGIEQVFPRHIQRCWWGYKKGHAKIICKASWSTFTCLITLLWYFNFWKMFSSNWLIFFVL